MSPVAFGPINTCRVQRSEKCLFTSSLNRSSQLKLCCFWWFQNRSLDPATKRWLPRGLILTKPYWFCFLDSHPIARRPVGTATGGDAGDAGAGGGALCARSLGGDNFCVPSWCVGGRTSVFGLISGMDTGLYTGLSVLRDAWGGRDPAELRGQGRPEGRLRPGLDQGASQLRQKPACSVLSVCRILCVCARLWCN